MKQSFQPVAETCPLGFLQEKQGCVYPVLPHPLLPLQLFHILSGMRISVKEQSVPPSHSTVLSWAEQSLLQAGLGAALTAKVVWRVFPAQMHSAENISSL